MTSLTERAMLIQLNVHLPQKSKHEKGMSAEIAAAHGTDGEMTKVTKQLFAKQSTARLASAATALRTFWESQTLVWSKGTRILPSANYFLATQKHRELSADFDAARDAFLDDFDAIKIEAKRRLNGAFNESDYPSRAAMARRIGVELAVYPMPTGEDFRVTLGDGEQERIREEIERNTNRAVENAIADLWQRTYTVVSEMLEKLARYAVDPATGKTIATFRDSAVENLRSMVDLLGRLNITDDRNLEAMRERLSATLCAHDADALRDSQPLRESAIDECKAVLAAMSGYCGDVSLDLAAE